MTAQVQENGFSGSATEDGPRPTNGVGPGADEWRWYVTRGAATILLGLLIAAFPLVAWIGLTALLVVYAFVDGVLALAACRGCHASRRWPLVLRGLAGLLLGAGFLVLPILAMISVGLVAAMLVAVWLLTTGAIEIAAALRYRKIIAGEWLLMLYGFLTIAAGAGLVVLIVLAPRATILSLAAFVGIYGAVAGLILVAHGIGLWRARQLALRSWPE